MNIEKHLTFSKLASLFGGVFVGSVVISLIIGIILSDKDDYLEPANTNQISTSTIATNINYTVAKKEDFSTGTAKRYVWKVVVKDELNLSELEQLSYKVIEEAKSDIPFNALSVLLYDRIEYIDGPYSLGEVIFAPFGNWAKADAIGIGKYEQMAYKYNLFEKDWTRKLTDEEIKVYDTYNKSMQSAYNSNQIPDETEVVNSTGEKFNLSQDEVKIILTKQINWVNDIK